MSTLNISLPDSMRKFVETQAEHGDFTASEYVRHLIRTEQESQKRRAMVREYLALCEHQIAVGDCGEWDMDEMLAEFERDYKRRKKPKK